MRKQTQFADSLASTRPHKQRASTLLWLEFMKKRNQDIRRIAFVSGNGKFHSDKNGTLTTVTFAQIEKMVDNPQEVDKGKAQWLIPSTLKTRNWKEQEANGEYWLLWADIDENPLALTKIEQKIKSIMPSARYEIFTSKSATRDNQKCRVLIPLDMALSAQQWRLAQECLNDAIEK